MSGEPAQWRPVVLPPTPSPSSESARAVLSRTARRDTAPELALRRALHRLGVRFLVDVPAPGTSRRRRVDVLLRGSRTAVLVHGCFWHGCPDHYHPPRHNAHWWRLKVASVQDRDRDTVQRLSAAGWLPLVVWEHEDMTAAAARVAAVHRLRRQLASCRLQPLDGPGDRRTVRDVRIAAQPEGGPAEMVHPWDSERRPHAP